jgi:hypothetical protein
MTDLLHPSVQARIALQGATKVQSDAKAAYDRAVTIGSTQARSKCETALRDATTRVMALEALL